MPWMYAMAWATTLALTLSMGVLLAGCGDCKGRIEVLEGQVPLEPGGTLELAYYFDENPVSTPEHCDGFWYVDGIEGGDAEVGTITPCGVYTAPSTPPAAPVTIMAATFAINTCADCCPYATLEVSFSSASP